MSYPIEADGPINRYLQATDKKREAFDEALQRGDPAATSIFAAEVLFGAIQHLKRTIEDKPGQSSAWRP